jgi:MFS family permease
VYLVHCSQDGLLSFRISGDAARSQSQRVSNPSFVCHLIADFCIIALTGVFLFGSTTSRSSATLLGWNCGYSFTSNIMYGVLYAISPELFPTKDRGTGNALVAAANRLFGITAPIIALYTNLATAAPIYVSASLFIVSSFIALLLPFEPRGKASL